MTNYEKIRNMTIEEMTEMLMSGDDLLLKPCNPECCKCFTEDGACGSGKEVECAKATRNWLESEAKQDG